MKTLESRDAPGQNSGQDGNGGSASPARRKVAFAVAGVLGLGALAGCNPGPWRHYEGRSSSTVTITEGECTADGHAASGHVLYTESASTSARCEADNYSSLGQCDPGILRIDEPYNGQSVRVRSLDDTTDQLTTLRDHANQHIDDVVRTTTTTTTTALQARREGSFSCAICVQVENGALHSFREGQPTPAEDPNKERFERGAFGYSLTVHLNSTVRITTDIGAGAPTYHAGSE